LKGASIHTYRTLKHHLLALEGDKNVFDFVLKTLITQSSLAIGKDINFEDLDDSPILNYKAINLFCA
jgi:hypothetical protein